VKVVPVLGVGNETDEPQNPSALFAPEQVEPVELFVTLASCAPAGGAAAKRSTATNDAARARSECPRVLMSSLPRVDGLPFGPRTSVVPVAQAPRRLSSKKSSNTE
jgi:hypothetical protein